MELYSPNPRKPKKPTLKKNSHVLPKKFSPHFLYFSKSKFFSHFIYFSTKKFYTDFRMTADLAIK